MTEKLITFAIQYCAVAGIAMTLLHIFGSSAFDMKLIREERHAKQLPNTSKNPSKQLLSIIVYAKNQATNLEQCLNALLSGDYSPIEIIIIDNKSSDDTRTIARQFIDNHPSERLTLYRPRTDMNRYQAIAHAFRARGRGKSILTIEGDEIVAADTLSRAQSYFYYHPQVSVLKPHVIVKPQYALTGLFESYLSLLQMKAKKLASVTNSDFEISATAFYTRKEFTSIFTAGTSELEASARLVRSGNQNNHYEFTQTILIDKLSANKISGFFSSAFVQQLNRTSDIMRNLPICFTPSKHYTRFFTWIRLPLMLCFGIGKMLIPVVLSYGIYLSIRLHEPTLLLLSLGIFSMLLLYAIWGEVSLSVHQKVYYSIGIPLAYVSYFCLAFVQSTAILLRSVQFGSLYL